MFYTALIGLGLSIITFLFQITTPKQVFPKIFSKRYAKNIFLKSVVIFHYVRNVILMLSKPKTRASKKNINN